MSKGLRIIINILIFLLIAGFVWYMVVSINKDEKSMDVAQSSEKSNFVSPYQQTKSYRIGSEIISFEISEDLIFAATNDSVLIFNISGERQGGFTIEKELRDMIINNDSIFLLYPAHIDIRSADGEKTGGWEACSENSDYCSITVNSGGVFVTDASNKNICQYTPQGGLVRFINSPEGFVIPNYSFDIININDTIYCSNSGRHKIESYTTDGEFIDSFGKTGNEAGAFAGCCNPAYLASTSWGEIITSEKGNPRISCYDRSGKFRTILFDSKSLGGGNKSYEVKVYNDNIYIVKSNEIVRYEFDPNITGSACSGCKADCPLRKGVDM